MATPLSILTADDLRMVSSQYGPGAVIGWILTAVSVLLSWTIDSRVSSKNTQSWSDRISADFLTTIIFPLVAAGDVAVQMNQYPEDLSVMMTTDDSSLQGRIHALEAPLVVVEDALLVNVPLLVAALYRRCYGKAATLAAVNSCGLAVESVFAARTAVYSAHRPYKNLSRSFLANSIPLLTVGIALIGLYELVLLASSTGSYIYSKSKTYLAQSSGGGGAADIELSANGNPAAPRRTVSSRTKWMLPLMLSPFGVVFLVLGNVAGNSFAFYFYVASHPSKGSDGFIQAAKLFFVELVPRTNSSILDLDQMSVVAVCAGLLLRNVCGLAWEQRKASNGDGEGATER